MRVLFDTNVYLDVLAKRKDFYRDSLLALECAFQNKCKVFISVISISDIMYISRKLFHSASAQRKIIREFISTLTICGVAAKQMRKAFDSDMEDFEDAVQSACAEKCGARFIVTRDKKDFVNSSVRALTPREFIALFL